MDRITPAEAIILLHSPISLAEKVEGLDDLHLLDVNEALENIQEPCSLPYSEFIELTTPSDTFSSWLNPFLRDNSCTRAAIALSIPYLDHTGPQPTGDEYHNHIHRTILNLLASLNHARISTGKTPDVSHICSEAATDTMGCIQIFRKLPMRCNHYIAAEMMEEQEGPIADKMEEFKKLHNEASRALQSTVSAAEMMEEEEGPIAENIEELEKLHNETATKAQTGIKPNGHSSESTNVDSDASLASDYPTIQPQQVSPPATNAATIMPDVSAYEDPASSEYAALDDQLFANHSSRNRNFHEMNHYRWKVEKLMKRRDHMCEKLSALKHRFCESELPLLLKGGKWYCRREEGKERLSPENLISTEEDTEMEDAEKSRNKYFKYDQMEGIEVWDWDEEILMDAETATALMGEDTNALIRTQEQIEVMSGDVSEMGMEDVL
ncbi:hypothetical protein MMC11_002422 [Xylographa trunciseda]|nr:hypothetical protein [Xylographa trunciseda]